MRLRRFNTAGIQAFEDFLATCREQPDTPLPLSLLEDEACTEAVTPTIEVEPMPFLVRSEAAHYFSGKLSALPEEEVRLDAGLWTWLSLFYFDQVCPPVDGKRTVKNSYYYVYQPMNARHFYRHLIFIGWSVQQLAPTYSRLFLMQPLSSLDKFTTEIMKRLFLTRVPCMFEVLDKLYWDENRERPRRGLVGSSKVAPGDVTHRLPVRIRQLERTYDLQSLNAEQLIELLGREFQFK
jgi:hypothetical protein